MNDPETLKAQSAERFRKLYAVMEELDMYSNREAEAREREERRNERQKDWRYPDSEQD